MSDLRTAAQQVLEALEHHGGNLPWNAFVEVRKDLRDALAQEQAEPVQEPVPCPTPKTCREHCCGGWCIPRAEPAQEQAEPLNLSDRAVQRRLAAQWGYVPAEQAEPAQEPAAWEASKDGCTIQGVDFTHDVVLRISGDFETDEQRISYAQSVVDALNAAPPRRTMVSLTEADLGKLYADWYKTPAAGLAHFARVVEKASWEKNK